VLLLISGPENGSAEVACEGATGVITTGGGFSILSEQPSYQRDAVNGYFDKLVDPGNNLKPLIAGYNRNGRGYPDISLLGYNYLVYIQSLRYALSGTSASSPVFAGMVSLVNAARKQAGKGSLGFLNPALYAYASEFTRDVTLGSNNCGVHGTICCEQGFQATTGWDPLTGAFPLLELPYSLTFLS